MTRRSLAILAAPLIVLALVAPVAAKAGMQARLDAPIPADTPPGTTIEVGWTTFQADDQGGSIVAFSGAPVFIALRAPGAEEPESVVFGDEYPAGSGHFTASIVVPTGGIAPDGVSIGLRGESCEAGVCERSDLPFVLVGPVLTAVAVPGAAAPDSGGTPVGAAAAPATTDAPDSLPWAGQELTIAGGVLIGGVLVVGLLALIRRRAVDGRLATD